MKTKGFTLIELMICVAILAIIAALVVPHLHKPNGPRPLGRAVVCHQDGQETIRSAASWYWSADRGSWHTYDQSFAPRPGDACQLETVYAPR